MKLKIDYILTGVLLIILIVFFNTTFSNIFSYNMDNGGHEQSAVFYNLNFFKHNLLYFDNLKFPFSSNIYTPIYYYVNYTCLHIYNLFEEIDVRSVYKVGRFISWFSCIFQVVIIYLIAKKLKISRNIALISAIFYLFNLSYHSFSIRPDSLKDLFFLINILFTIQFIKSNKIKHFVCAIIFALLSIFTKQDVIIYILSFSIIFIIYKRGGIFAVYSISILTFSILISFVLNVYYNGIFLTNIINTNIEFSWAFLIRWVLQLEHFFSISWTFLGIIILAFPYRNKTYLTSTAITLLYLLIVMLVTVKFGADKNYYTQLYFALSITTAYSLMLILKKSKFSFNKLLVVVLILICFYNLKLPQTNKPIDEKKFKDEYFEIKEVSNYLKSNYNGHTLLIFDQDFIAFLPYKMMFKGFNMIYFDYLYSKYGFEGKEDLTISNEFKNKDAFREIENIDYLILKETERNSILYNKKYKEKYLLVENYKGYNVYINYRLIR